LAAEKTISTVAVPGGSAELIQHARVLRTLIATKVPIRGGDMVRKSPQEEYVDRLAAVTDWLGVRVELYRHGPWPR